MNGINVIIANYKHEAYLPDAINGIRQNTMPFPVRILLFQDEPGFRVDEYEHSRLAIMAGTNYPIFTYHDNMNNGQSARFNQGILQSTLQSYKAEWIAFQGADDISMPWRFSVCAQHAKNADVIYTDAVQLSGQDKRLYIKSQPFDSETLKQRNFIVATTVMVRTEVAEHILFDEDVKYGEDWLWYHKLYLAGARFKYIPVPTVYYRDYTSQINVRYGVDWAKMKHELIGRIHELYK